VSCLPVAAQPVPYGPEQGDVSRGRIAGSLRCRERQRRLHS
jgi:hypothetical protein